MRQQREAERLLACRDAQTLRWHFGAGPYAGRTQILVAELETQGYLILVREDAPEIGLKRIKIADALVANDRPDVPDHERIGTARNHCSSSYTRATHLSFYATNYGNRPVDDPTAYLAEHVSITLPLYAGMTGQEQDTVVGALADEYVGQKA